MYDVFLSYSRKDIIVANQIYKELCNDGLNVFFDRQSIGPENFPKRIAQGIKESKAVLFLASHNSTTATYAPDELVFAKNNKPRNAIIIYRIDSCIFPDDIELLFASLNQRDITSDSIEVILDDIKHILAEGEISSTPRVTKSTSIDSSLNELLDAFRNLDFYSVIYKEIETCYWKNNWNHHLLLMMSYKSVGDRRNYGILLNEYHNSGVVYYPQFYSVISQVWHMIEFGYIKEAKTHIRDLLQAKQTLADKICSQVNHTHLLLLSGNHHEALNNYKDILQTLDANARYSYLLKDFDTLNWIGYNQLNYSVISSICAHIGYRQKNFNTSIESHLACKRYEEILCSHRWHWRENRLHIILSFKTFNNVGNSIYYFVEYERNVLGKLFDVLPFGIDESSIIQKTGRAFCQYRLTNKNGRVFIEEFNPMTEVVSCGELMRITSKELHIKILDNGNPQLAGKIRKYKAIT
ncbi:MAG: toll/interleukin-1 receptor domain-containing protein [Prevotellaceae bacterium]|nr:toll/interleukin-1 receptor domain-containing protein [Prevotellaceae bacterium]